MSMKEYSILKHQEPKVYPKDTVSGYKSQIISCVLIMLLVISHITAFAQKQIQGVVKDENNIPISGASVVVKGSTLSTASDAKGQFTIAAKNSDILVISFLGKVQNEVPVGNSNSLDIVLQNSQDNLDEVVVVGYGTQSRDKLTTSISKVDQKVLENTAYTNVGSALQGAVAGLRVQSTSGMPGAAPRIILRGGTSINNPNGASPLYIVDGVIRSSGLDDLNADDIASMQVLKDAAATAIYGARGSNGVVIVTTKTGKAGQTNISYAYDFASSNAMRLMDFASAADYIKYGRLSVLAAAQKNPSLIARLTGANGMGTGNDLTNNTAFTTQYLTSANEFLLNEGWQTIEDPTDPSKTIIFKETNFQDLVYRTGNTHNHNLNVSGGSDVATFNVGLGYISGEGIAIQSDYKRLSLNANGSLKVRDNLKINSNLIYSNRSNNAIASSIANLFYRSPSTPATAKYTFQDGSLAPGAGRGIGNPHYHYQGEFAPRGDDKMERLTLSVGGQWDIIEGLKFEPILSLNRNSGNNYLFTPAYLNGPGNLVTSRASTANVNKETQYQFDGVLSYAKTISSHNFDAKVGFSHFQRNLWILSAAGQGAATDLIPTLNASPTPTIATGTDSDLVIQGLFSRINYDFASKYLVSLNVRYDGASNLGSSYKFGFFPGVSIGWNVHKEEFFKPLSAAISDLKLRASYGVNGNISGLSDFQAQGSYDVNARYNGLSSIYAGMMPNNDLQWEESKTLDFGLDLGLFNRRINIIADYYVRNTDNLLTAVSLPPSSGYSSVTTNYGSLQNRGVEVELNANILNPASSVQWNLGFNAGYTKEKITSLPYNGILNNRIGGTQVFDRTVGDYVWIGGLQEGRRLTDIIGYQLNGVYATDADALNSGVVDNILTTADKTKYGGDAIWEDFDGNNIIDLRDQKVLGNALPLWTGGISNTVSYKGISVYTRFDYTTGHSIENYAARFADGQFQGDGMPTKKFINEMWKEQGDVAKAPRYVWQAQTQNMRVSNYYVQKGDFLAIREVTISYQFPSEVAKRMKLGSLRANLTGNNLHYFTKYDGVVPEEGGTDNGHYTIPRTFGFGLRASF